MDKSRLAKSKPPTKLQPTGRAKSCTYCRQAKVACDARKIRNGQCSRCRLKQLDCRFDANFRRIPTRRLVKVLLSSTYDTVLTKIELQKKLVKSYTLCALAKMHLMESQLLWKQSHLPRIYRLAILQRLRGLSGAKLRYGLILQTATQPVLTS
jgi:hypothetical protein